MDIEQGKYILDLRSRIVSNFDLTNWEEVGLLTGLSDFISNHPRLLRSLGWGDEDYSGNVLSVLKIISQNNSNALSTIERYIDEKFPVATNYISSKPSPKKITFAPNVFQIPEMNIESDLVAVMMPIRAEFTNIYSAIKHGCQSAGFRCLRADDIWEESTIIQDIFNLVYRAQIIIVDFTGKNPNVMYETGIAHTLGKHVIPLSQSLDDLPFDMAHHRVLKYLPNQEGLSNLETKLAEKLRQTST
jgi:hypothetical protein